MKNSNKIAKWINSKIVKSSSGFTMIELLVVATIMILLTMIGLVSYQSTSRKARNGKRAADIENVRSALVLYRTDNPGYPDDGSFDLMMSAITDYTSTDVVMDPKDTAPYVYEYNPALCSGGFCRDFTLCYYEEPDGTQVCVGSP